MLATIAGRAAVSGRDPFRLPDSLRDASFWYDLDEASGTRYDKTANASHLTDNNTVGAAAGIVGTSALFVAASTEYLSVADNVSISTGNIDFTIAAWLYLTDEGSLRSALSRWNATGGQREWELGYESATDKWFFSVSDDGAGTNLTTVREAVVVAVNTWNLVIAYHDAAADTINLKVNNGTTTSAAFTFGVFDSTADLTIGGRHGGQSQLWEGRVDAAGFWKRVLSANDMAALWNGGAGRRW